jgi:hypothetical protein
MKGQGLHVVERQIADSGQSHRSLSRILAQFYDRAWLTGLPPKYLIVLTLADHTGLGATEEIPLRAIPR